MQRGSRLVILSLCFPVVPFLPACLLACLLACQMESPQCFVDSGPSFIALFHPALGPLWSVVRQKVRRWEEGGSLSCTFLHRLHIQLLHGLLH